MTKRKVETILEKHRGKVKSMPISEYDVPDTSYGPSRGKTYKILHDYIKEHQKCGHIAIGHEVHFEADREVSARARRLAETRGHGMPSLADYGEAIAHYMSKLEIQHGAPPTDEPVKSIIDDQSTVDDKLS